MKLCSNMLYKWNWNAWNRIFYILRNPPAICTPRKFCFHFLIYLKKKKHLYRILKIMPIMFMASSKLYLPLENMHQSRRNTQNISISVGYSIELQASQAFAKFYGMGKTRTTYILKLSCWYTYSIHLIRYEMSGYHQRMCTLAQSDVYTITVIQTHI